VNGAGGNREGTLRFRSPPFPDWSLVRLQGNVILNQVFDCLLLFYHDTLLF
jgi:hypothetical protein